MFTALVYDELEDITAESVCPIEICFSEFASLHENIHSFINENFKLSK